MGFDVGLQSLHTRVTVPDVRAFAKVFQRSEARSTATTLRAQFVFTPHGRPIITIAASDVGTTAMGVSYAVPLRRPR